MMVTVLPQQQSFNDNNNDDNTARGAAAAAKTVLSTDASAHTFVKSYGAMTVTMQFLPPLEQLHLQGCSKWMYEHGVSRVQTRLAWPKTLYFHDQPSGKLITYNNAGIIKELPSKLEVGSTELYGILPDQWICTKVGQCQVFQISSNSTEFRMMNFKPANASNFTIEREGHRTSREKRPCIANLNDKYIFVMGGHS